MKLKEAIETLQAYQTIAGEDASEHRSMENQLGPREPDNSMVICPNCTCQFAAISVNDQKERERLRAALEAIAKSGGRWGEYTAVKNVQCIAIAEKALGAAPAVSAPAELGK